MAKTRTRNRATEEELAEEEEYTEDDEEIEEELPAAAEPMSDSRSRRKRKRGQMVQPDVVAAPGEKKDRPTPSRRKTAKSGTKRSAGPVGRVVQRIPVVRGFYNYLAAAIAEMKKVTWPTREEMQRLTQMVLGITIAFSLGLGLIDVFYGWWFRQALSDEIVFLGIGAVVAALAGAFTWVVFGRHNQYSPF
ncbi:MAG: preprotein translocase subunit SecE [Chloroflexi bacterium]|nr:preprotein translocase subunit SecE [Chloroflexota bacterium]